MLNRGGPSVLTGQYSLFSRQVPDLKETSINSQYKCLRQNLKRHTDKYHPEHRSNLKLAPM